jgi:signal transduction histidine kinase
VKSLKGRLSVALAVSLVVLLALQWLIAGIAVDRLTEQQLVTRLSNDAQSLLAALQIDTQGGMQLDPRRVSPRYQRPFSGYYYTVDSGGSREVSRSLWDSAFEFPAMEPGRTRTLRTTGPERQPLLVVAQGFRKHDHNITIAVGENLGTLNAGLRRFHVIHGVVSVAVLLALLLVQRLILRSGLKPLDDVRRNMERLAQGKATRIEMDGPSEIAPLIAQLNRMLSTMGKRSRRSRDALGNLAHALKTRLTILTQIADQPQFAAHPHLRSSLRDATDSISRIVERELKRARLAGDALPGQQVELRDELALLSRTLQVLYAEKSPNIEWQVASGAGFTGDREDLLELLGNLLDNACKWCRGRVAFTATNGRSMAFVVEDDGPGCAEDELDALTRRGFRADESLPGSGLGLAIVRDIVESYGGDLSFGRSAALGGLRVEVKLPGANAVGD